jgi:hypothetical protein
MKASEVKQLRARRIEIVKPKAPTISSEEIASHVQEFEARGGIITRIPIGVSAETDVAMPIGLALDYRKAQNKLKRRFNGQIKK